MEGELVDELLRNTADAKFSPASAAVMAGSAVRKLTQRSSSVLPRHIPCDSKLLSKLVLLALPTTSYYSHDRRLWLLAR